MNNDLPRVHDIGPYLLPPITAEICKSLGIQLWTASQLYKTGLIGFDPETTEVLNDSQQAELCFVGALVAANCSFSTLAELLSGLTKPYNFSHQYICYCWPSKIWKVMPQEPDEREITFQWLDSLAEDGDIETLQEIHDQAGNLLDG